MDDDDGSSHGLGSGFVNWSVGPREESVEEEPGREEGGHHHLLCHCLARGTALTRAASQVPGPSHTR